jgi:putative FmdB family regulatory protein
MPIYAYRCESCGHAKDVLQKISDPLLSVCPACGAESFKKQLTSAGFQLKGSGWYVTDFRGGATPAGAEAGKEGASSPEPTGDKSSDKGADKPAATPTAAPGAASTAKPAPAAPVAAPPSAPAASGK